MTLRSLARAWDDFFFKPQSPLPVALFRIAYGFLVIVNLFLLRGDWENWFGTHSFVSFETMRQMAAGPRINLFVFIAQNEFWINALFWFFLLAAICLMAGFFTRASSIAVFVCLVSIHQRNLFILHSGDTLMRVSGFFLMFAPAGAALSVDRLIRIWRGREGLEIRPRAPWAQRMIQFETALAYFVTFYIKSGGTTWVDGTATYYVLRLDEFRRFPVPDFLKDPFMTRIQTWATLAIEFALGVLVWFRELRYVVLLAGLALHVSLEYSMNVPLFQWMIVATYLTFIYPEDLARAWEWVRARVAPRFGKPVVVVYDGESDKGRRTANLLRAIDILGLLRLVDGQSQVARPEAGGSRGLLLVATPWGMRAGFDGLRFAARATPLLWPLALTSVFGPPTPGVSRTTAE
jgi:hypothetical protein